MASFTQLLRFFVYGFLLITLVVSSYWVIEPTCVQCEPLMGLIAAVSAIATMVTDIVSNKGAKTGASTSAPGRAFSMHLSVQSKAIEFGVSVRPVADASAIATTGNNYSAEVKTACLIQLVQGISLANVSRTFNVPEQVLRRWFNKALESTNPD